MSVPSPQERLRLRSAPGPSGCINWTGVRTQQGYGYMKINKRMYRVHRLAYEFAKGAIPAGLHIDHMCHNTSCINPEHLRAVTQAENNQNRRGAQAGTASGHRGVWRHKTGKWVAGCVHNGRSFYAGFYEDPLEAAEAARQLRLSLFTHNDVDRR